MVQFCVSISYAYPFERTSAIHNLENSLAFALTNLDKEKTSIDILYNIISRMLAGISVKSFSLKYSEQIEKDGKKEWIDTDYVSNQNGVITLFRITKAGRTIEVDDFENWTNHKPPFVFPISPSSQNSFTLNEFPSEEVLSKFSSFDFVSEYEQAEQEAKEASRLINTL